MCYLTSWKFKNDIILLVLTSLIELILTKIVVQLIIDELVDCMADVDNEYLPKKKKNIRRHWCDVGHGIFDAQVSVISLSLSLSLKKLWFFNYN